MTSITTTPSTVATTETGTPEGFWVLFISSVVYSILLILLVAWLISPRRCWRCCCHCRRHYRYVAKEADEILIRAGYTSSRPESNPVDIEEDWWSVEGLQKNEEENKKKGNPYDMADEEKQHMESVELLNFNAKGKGKQQQRDSDDLK